MKPHASFSVLGVFQNTMMVLLTGAMVMGLPYVIVRPVSVHCARCWAVLKCLLDMKNADPQTLEDIKGQQAKFATIQNLIQWG